MKNLFIILCCFVIGMLIAKHTDKGIDIPRIESDISTEPVVKEVVSNISKKLKNKSYTNWWTKGADSLDELYSGEELITYMREYVHNNIVYKNDTNIMSSGYTENNSKFMVNKSFDIAENIKYNISKHKGVCVDHSICFMLMCKYLNIEVYCIEVPNHMLNIVNINGNKIYVDATWNVEYHSFDELKESIIKEKKGMVATYGKEYGEITYPEKFNYHVYSQDTNNKSIYSVKPYKLYDSFGGCYSKEAIDILVYKKPL